MFYNIKIFMQYNNRYINQIGAHDSREQNLFLLFVNFFS